MTITSPPSGAHVHGAATVTANVSGLGSAIVAGVQFKLDGANLGAEDTAAPYSVPWDTTTASEGWHTLTAVARDAGGGRSSSAPVTVTVGNSPPPSVPVTRYENTNASVTYSAGWIQDSNFPWS
ncbi:MAG: Ig-like domain-containing protein [Burkholderiales bacterium]